MFSLRSLTLLSISTLSLVAAIDVGADTIPEVAGLTGAIPDLSASELSPPIIPIPRHESRLSRRHRLHRRHYSDVEVAAGVAVGCKKIFVDLKVSVEPILAKIEALVAQVKTGTVDGVVVGVQSEVATLVSTLETQGVDLVKGVGSAAASSSSKSAPSNNVVAAPLASVFSQIADTFQLLHGIEDSVPGLGPVLSSVTTEVQTTLASLLGVVGEVAAPLLQTVKGLLGPAEDLLRELGLCPVVDVVNSILGSVA